MSWCLNEPIYRGLDSSTWIWIQFVRFFPYQLIGSGGGSRTPPPTIWLHSRFGWTVLTILTVVNKVAFDYCYLIIMVYSHFMTIYSGWIIEHPVKCRSGQFWLVLRLKRSLWWNSIIYSCFINVGNDCCEMSVKIRKWNLSMPF